MGTYRVEIKVEIKIIQYIRVHYIKLVSTVDLLAIKYIDTR